MKYRLFDNGVRVPAYVLTHATYKKYKVAELATLVAAAVPLMREHLDFSDSIDIIIKPIRMRDRVGQYHEGRDEVVLDFRRGSRYSLISTLAHELTHAEQYFTGRLTREWKKWDWVYQWENNVIGNKGSTFQSYMKLPWEIEARERQDGIALMVCDDLAANGTVIDFYEGM